MPLVLSVALFSIYALVHAKPRLIPQAGDARKIFGADLSVLLFIAWIPLILLLVRAFDALVFDLAMSRRRQVPVPPLLRDIVAIALYGLLFGSAFSQIFRYNFATLLTTSAVLAAILGLALQDTLGNLFAGIALHLEDSFEVGDVIKSGEHIGRVESVSWRATRIRTYNNEFVLLPNSLISRDRIEVYPRDNLNARLLQIGIDYHCAPAQVIEVLRRAAAHVEGVAHEMPCIARILSFGDSSITYEIKYHVRDYMLRDRIDADIRKAVWYALRRNGIATAFPVRSFQPYTPPQHDRDKTIDRDEIIDRLRGVDILAPLSETALETIADGSIIHIYSRGEAIISRGAAGSSMFVIHKGSVSIRVPDPDATGTRQVAELTEGGIFGEMALLTGEKRTADVIASSDVTAIEIDKEALHPVLVEHPDLAVAISAKVAERRGHLESLREDAAADDEPTILGRIREYFGL